MKKCLLQLSLVYSIVSVLCSAQPDLIKSFKIINKNRVVVKANEEFSQKFIKEDFFAEYDEGIDLTKMDESIVIIPFILNVVPIVWLSNEDYFIDVMDKDLYYSLQKIKEVFRMFYPQHSWEGELIPKKLVTNTIGSSNKQDQPALALLFSGGLDSVNTSISYVDTKQLLITVWGADVKVRARRLWGRVLEQCQNFSQTYGHDHTFVKSNFREFTETHYLYSKFPRWWVRVSHALSLVGLVAPLLIVHNIPILFFSSTYTAEHPYSHGSHPAIDNNISFAGSAVYLVQTDKERVQKITNINATCKKKQLPLPYLRVCWSNPLGKNCLKCEKCMSTCTNIIAAGQRPREYGFNIDIKKVVKNVQKILGTKEYLHIGQIFHWRRSLLHLDALPENKSYATLPKNDMEKLLNFLHSINFEQYRNLQKDMRELRNFLYSINLERYTNPQRDIEKLRNFLRSINFERYVNPRNRIYSPQELELFATLWDQYVKKDSEIKSVVR